MSSHVAGDGIGPRLMLHYVHGDDVSYGRVGAGLAAALRRRGVDVVDPAPSDLSSIADASVPRTVTWISSPFHALGAWEHQVPTLITMWETDRLPDSFRRTLPKFATVLVPSDENLELFSGFHADVRRVSFGVDTDRWCFTPRPSGGDFVFLTAGSGSRKGIDLAHAAFLRAFPSGSWGSGPRPCLVIKDPRNGRYGGERVRVVPGLLPADDERTLYASAHCYVQASRGEGFGLQPLQAIAMGIPTILTDAHGHRDYAHLGIPVPAVKVPSDFFVFGESGHWWELNLDDLVDSMRSVYENYDTAVSQAAASARVAAKSFAWDRGAAQLIEALGGHDALATPRGTMGRWKSFDEPHYRIVTRRDFTINSAGSAHSFIGGQESAAPAHVKRLLFEGGLLDATCLDVPALALSPLEIDLLAPAQREEYLGWVIEAKRVPARLGLAGGTTASNTPAAAGQGGVRVGSVDRLTQSGAFTGRSMIIRAAAVPSSPPGEIGQQVLSHTPNPEEPMVDSYDVWSDNINAEVEFWRTALGGSAAGGPLADRATVRPLQQWVRDEIPAGTAPLRILDVGSGPLTTLGSTWAERELEVIAVDPLADEYDAILDELAIVPPVRAVRGRGEMLREQFGENSFDFVLSANAIDHCVDPVVVIEQMLAVAKPGATLFMNHLIDVADQEGHAGLHQWNLRPVGNDMIIEGYDRHVLLTEIVGGCAVDVVDRGADFVARVVKR